MRYNRIQFSPVVMSVLVLAACSGIPESYTPSDQQLSVSDSGDIQSALEIPENTQFSSTALLNPSLPEQYGSIRELKAAMEASDAPDIDPSEVRELMGLPEGYIESGIERNTDRDYSVFYARSGTEASPIAFTPCLTEAALDDVKSSLLMNNGTYEILSENKLVSNIVKSDIPVSRGNMYECTYDTAKKTGLKLRYHEYTDPESTVRYLISSCYDTDGTHIDSDVFVYSGANSFAVCAEAEMRLEAVMVLRSVPVE